MNPKELTISSGGARGVLALGAVHALSKAQALQHVETYSGTSVGAVIAAGLALGVAPGRMLAVAVRHPIQADIKPGRYGLDTGRGLCCWIRRILQLRQKMTLGDVYERTGKKLVVCVCNLSEKKSEYWSHETHPDMSLVKALRISCSIPLVFSAVKHNGHIYVDGAVVQPVPITGNPREAMTIVFDAPPKPINTMNDFVASLRSVVVHSDVCPRYNVVIDPGSVDPLDIGMTADKLQAAYRDGKRQASKWVKKNI